MPIPIPKGVEVTIGPDEVTVAGSNGSLSKSFHKDMEIKHDNGALSVHRPSDERHHRALHGLTRSLLANMVTGVSDGFSRTLDLVGVGYRAQQNGAGVILSVMFSHPVEVEPVEGVTLEVEGVNRIHVRGIDKQMVGQVAAQIRAVRPPNIYTGKGIRYLNEQVKLKPGKSARKV
jgi:large subunit ribosomal protein L6